MLKYKEEPKREKGIKKEGEKNRNVSRRESVKPRVRTNKMREMLLGVGWYRSMGGKGGHM